MADVFISYKREERPRCVLIHDKLFELGFSVWFDAKQEIGKEFDREIEREVMAARCVVTLWSPAAVDSVWVRSESAKGLEYHKLAGAMIEKTKLPMPYNLNSTADLTDFSGDYSHPGWLQLIDRIATLCDRPGLRRLLMLLANGDVNGAAEWSIENYTDPVADRAVPWVADELRRRTGIRLAALRQVNTSAPAQRRGAENGGDPADAPWGPPPLEPEQWREEEENWRQIFDSIDYRDFDDHCSRFPAGRYADDALQRSAELQAK